MNTNSASHFDTWLWLIFICVCCVGRIVTCCPHQLSLRWICRASTFSFHKLKFITYVRMYTLVATQQCASLFMQPKIVSIFFTAFRQFRVVTMASVHASQDVWFLHSCSEWCHCLGPEQNASCARQSHAVISKFFFQLWKYMKIFHRVFFIYCLWKRISANTQTSGNTKESLPIHRHPVIQSIILSDKHCSSFPPSDMYVGSQLSGPC